MPIKDPIATSKRQLLFSDVGVSFPQMLTEILVASNRLTAIFQLSLVKQIGKHTTRDHSPGDAECQTNVHNRISSLIWMEAY